MIPWNDIPGWFGAIMSVALFYPQISGSLKSKKTKQVMAGTYYMIMILDLNWMISSYFSQTWYLFVACVGAFLCCVTMLLLKRKYDKND